MLDGLRQFISEIVSPDTEQRVFDETDYRLAATALLIHVVSLDGDPTAVEKRKLHSLIETSFKLDPGTADRLIASATRAENDAVDLYRFTSVIMREVDEAGRRRIVEMMWEMVFADGKVTEFEDNVLWRAADLLGISGRDRIDLKHQVQERQAARRDVTCRTGSICGRRLGCWRSGSCGSRGRRGTGRWKLVVAWGCRAWRRCRWGCT